MKQHQIVQKVSFAKRSYKAPRDKSLNEATLTDLTAFWGLGLNVGIEPLTLGVEC